MAKTMEYLRTRIREAITECFYRTDIAEKYGLTDKLNSVKTFDDVIPILEIVKEKRAGYCTSLRERR